MSEKKMKKYLDMVVSNIEKDRKKANILIDDLMKLIEVDKSKHKEIGIVAAKYLEVLQRSNEQLVKITEIIQKNSKKNEEEFSAEEKEEIFDSLNKEYIEKINAN